MASMLSVGACVFVIATTTSFELITTIDSSCDDPFSSSSDGLTSTHLAWWWYRGLAKTRGVHPR